MANWSKPALPDSYPDFLDSLNARDLDAGTLFLVDPTNPPVGVIRFNRSLNVFQEWNGSTWVTKILASAGGGTGQGTAINLGTMAAQNANNVNITGGNIIGLSNLSNNGNGYNAGQLHVAGILYTGGGVIQLTDANGRIPAIDSTRFANLNGQNLTNMNAGQLTHGIAPGSVLGTGYTGTGSKVLLDNGQWIDKYQTGGGMIEIVHNDTGIGTGEAVGKTVNILWQGAAPTSIKKIDIRLNDQTPNIKWKVLNTTQFQIVGAVEGSVVAWTAFHYITLV